MTITAIIAEDEPILALTLQKHLNQLWPELHIQGLAENGYEAVELALHKQVDILFLDIKMPGKTGLEVAQELAEEWPEHKPFPLIVYVTAYDEYALAAFETAVADYVLKPVSAERLQKTIQRLHERLGNQSQRQQELDKVLNQLQQLLPNQAQTGLAGLAAKPQPGAEPLHIIKAAVGNQIRMIPIESVLYFEATDKYINVVTREHSSLIRSSLRELLPQLDASIFWQIHRSTVVNSRAIHLAHKDESGKITLSLHDCPDKLSVSRVYAHLFKQM